MPDSEYNFGKTIVALALLSTWGSFNEAQASSVIRMPVLFEAVGASLWTKWVLLCCRCLEARVLSQANEVGHDAEGAGDTLGHLPVEGECHIDIGALAVVSV